ncbi:hypothetical protein ETR_22756 [Erwinia tracheiphila PSU-1]|nr:hypothetical protein ETR_22756 [Erwinia tracheiphila PSU-1]
MHIIKTEPVIFSLFLVAITEIPENYAETSIAVFLWDIIFFFNISLFFSHYCIFPLSVRGK